MTSAPPFVGAPKTLARATRTILVVDVVESARLVELDEPGVVARWFAFCQVVETQLIANGRIVKTLGDGLLIEFGDVQSAVGAALRIQNTARHCNAGIAHDLQIHLRMGMEVADVILEHNDVHGRGVNLAYRLTSLANPGEIVVSQPVRDRLAPTLDADVEDLGECYLRHLREPVRAYRLTPPGRISTFRAFVASEDLWPSIAVIPFTARGELGEHVVLGEVIAEHIIEALSLSPEINVVSRLSTTVFRGRKASLADVRDGLHADYALSGSYRIADFKVIFNVELAVTRSGLVLWTERLTEKLSNVVSEGREFVGSLITKICAAVRARELRRSRTEPLPTVEAYALLMGAVTLTHRLTRSDFEEGHRLLLALLDRRSREPTTLAWLANWHNLRVQQGWSSDREHDGRTALDYARRALDIDPDCSQALTVNGLIETMLFKHLDLAEESYDRALRANPSNPLAWLQKGTLHAFRSEGRQAVAHTERANKLSPLDPHRYLYDSLTATAYIAAEQYDVALEFAKESLRANRKHTSTLRAMIVAQWHTGLQEEARQTARDLLALEPSLTVSGWLRRSPAAEYPVGRNAAKTMRLAGVPD